jgi:hypothetical protein
MENKKLHWETVYETKSPEQVSWTQEIPKTSLEMITASHVGKDAAIIDIGGGDSNLVDFLIEDGYSNITVLDISGKALARAKKRLGSNAEKVNWIESDIIHFKPAKSYDIWHDRAAFHFLTNEDDIQSYLTLCGNFIKDSLILGTFSHNGPFKCSGLDITQYNEDKIKTYFEPYFFIEQSLIEDHTTPFNTTQNFLFSRLRKK